MKRLSIAAGILCFLLAAASLSAQTARNTPADVIVLMDTSGTVLPYYEVINKRVLQSIISKFIRIGDSFHLLSFNAEARYEMSQKIGAEADLSRVVSRFMLLYQLGQSADFLSGIHFAEQYMQKLPSTQEKILIIISDGIFNPPETSRYRRYTAEQVKTELAQTAAAIRAAGWKVYYVKLPFPADAVIKDLDGTLYAGKLDSTGNIDRSGVDTADNTSTPAANAQTAADTHSAAARSTAAAVNADTARTTGNTTADNRTSAAANTAQDAAVGSTVATPAGTDTADRNRAHVAQPNAADFTEKVRTAAAGDNTTQPVQTTQTAGTPADMRTPGSTATSAANRSTAENSSLQAGSANQHTDTSARVPAPENDAGSDINRSDNADTFLSADSSKTAEPNSIIADADSAQTADTNASGSVQRVVKEYTDVSQTFTENLGIETSDLPVSGGIQFKDTVLPLSHVIFPENIDTSGSQLALPLTIVSAAAEPVDIILQAVAVEVDGKTSRQDVTNLSAHILPQAKTTITVRTRLPESIRSQGQYWSTIRLDLVQNDKHFSQAAAVHITIKPSFFKSFLAGNTRWILLAGSSLILLLILILFVRRRVPEPAPYTARRLGQVAAGQQKSTQQREAAQQDGTLHATDMHKNTRTAITSSDKRYYPDQQANKNDPRESLNTFNSQTAAAAAEAQRETASRMNYLAQEQSRNMEGRFALLNSTENRLSRRPNFSQNYYGRISTKPSQSGMTELFVYNQTTSIGKRNIHVMKPGSRMSIGGSKNDSFLIFLVPFPANLAQIQYDGSKYQISILKPEYFPYENSNIIHNCIGRDITVVSKKGYHVTFIFRGYEDPKIRLNTILTSINYIEEDTKNV